MRALIASLKASDTRQFTLLAVFTLVAFAAIAFGRTVGYGILGDGALILEPWINDRDVGRAFTDLKHGLWMPLVYLSWMLDVTVFGTTALTSVDGFSFLNKTALNPAFAHISDIVWHLVCGGLLLAFLLKLTEGKSRFLALAVTALWLVHPLQLDTAAQIAERKNSVNLSMILASCLAYLSFAETRSFKAGALTAAFFVLALASKPTACVLPVIYLLIDAYKSGFDFRAIGIRKILEKVPFFVAAVILGIVTLVAQTQATIRTPGDLEISAANFAVMFGRIFWPFNLNPSYAEYGSELPYFAVAGVLLAAALVAVAVIYRKRQPLITFGIVWYLLTIFPTLNLSISIGISETYDHYSHAPLVGFAVVLMALPWPKVIAGVAILATALTVTIAGRWNMYDVEAYVGSFRPTALGQLTLCEMRLATSQDHKDALQCAIEVGGSTRFWWQQRDAAKLTISEAIAVGDTAVAKAASERMLAVQAKSKAFNDSRWWMRLHSAVMPSQQ